MRACLEPAALIRRMNIYIYIYIEREREGERLNIYIYIHIYTHMCMLYIYIYIYMPVDVDRIESQTQGQDPAGVDGPCVLTARCCTYWRRCLKRDSERLARAFQVCRTFGFIRGAASLTLGFIQGTMPRRRGATRQLPTASAFRAPRSAVVTAARRGDDRRQL